MKELTIYLRSGNRMIIECNHAKFEWDKNTQKYIGYSIQGAKVNFGIDPEQIEAWEDSDIVM